MELFHSGHVAVAAMLDYFASGCEHLNSTSHSSHRSPCSAAGSTDGDNFCSPTSCTVTSVALMRDKCKIQNCPVKSNSTCNILRIYAFRGFSHNSNIHQDENHCSRKTISYVEGSFTKTQMVYRSSGGCSCCCDWLITVVEFSVTPTPMLGTKM